MVFSNILTVSYISLNSHLCPILQSFYSPKPLLPLHITVLISLYPQAIRKPTN